MILQGFLAYHSVSVSNLQLYDIHKIDLIIGSFHRQLKPMDKIDELQA